MLLISLPAQNDLRAIHAYGADRWGTEIADRYIDRLIAGMRRLETQPRMGAERSELLPDVRSLVVSSHVIYYMTPQTNIEILRVLHSRQDAASNMC